MIIDTVLGSFYKLCRNITLNHQTPCRELTRRKMGERRAGHSRWVRTGRRADPSLENMRWVVALAMLAPGPHHMAAALQELPAGYVAFTNTRCSSYCSGPFFAANRGKFQDNKVGGVSHPATLEGCAGMCNAGACNRATCIQPGQCESFTFDPDYDSHGNAWCQLFDSGDTVYNHQAYSKGSVLYVHARPPMPPAAPASFVTYPNKYCPTDAYGLDSYRTGVLSYDACAYLCAVKEDCTSFMSFSGWCFTFNGCWSSGSGMRTSTSGSVLYVKAAFLRSPNHPPLPPPPGLPPGFPPGPPGTAIRLGPTDLPYWASYESPPGAVASGALRFVFRWTKTANFDVDAALTLLNPGSDSDIDCAATGYHTCQGHGFVASGTNGYGTGPWAAYSVLLLETTAAANISFVASAATTVGLTAAIYGQEVRLDLYDSTGWIAAYHVPWSYRTPPEECGPRRWHPVVVRFELGKRTIISTWGGADVRRRDRRLAFEFSHDGLNCPVPTRRPPAAPVPPMSLPPPALPHPSNDPAFAPGNESAINPFLLYTQQSQANGRGSTGGSSAAQSKLPLALGLSLSLASLVGILAAFRIWYQRRNVNRLLGTMKGQSSLEITYMREGVAASGQGDV